MLFLKLLNRTRKTPLHTDLSIPLYGWDNNNFYLWYGVHPIHRWVPPIYRSHYLGCYSSEQEIRNFFFFCCKDAAKKIILMHMVSSLFWLGIILMHRRDDGWCHPSLHIRCYDGWLLCATHNLCDLLFHEFMNYILLSFLQP